jgi:sodium/potassium/calcium exchanger 6
MSLLDSVSLKLLFQAISPTLAGITFLAFANGAPDVLTAIVAGSSSSQSTALIPFGSIFGGLLFSAAFILSSVIFQSPD